MPRRKRAAPAETAPEVPAPDAAPEPAPAPEEPPPAPAALPADPTAAPPPSPFAGRRAKAEARVQELLDRFAARNFALDYEETLAQSRHLLLLALTIERATCPACGHEAPRLTTDEAEARYAETQAKLLDRHLQDLCVRRDLDGLRAVQGMAPRPPSGPTGLPHAPRPPHTAHAHGSPAVRVPPPAPALAARPPHNRRERRLVERADRRRSA